MTTYLITRHLGAVDWARKQGMHFDVHVTHLSGVEHFQKGDVVLGTLPVNIVNQLNCLGVRYKHLSMKIPEHLRGIELSAEQLDACEAELLEFETIKVKNKK